RVLLGIRARRGRCAAYLRSASRERQGRSSDASSQWPDRADGEAYDINCGWSRLVVPSQRRTGEVMPVLSRFLTPLPPSIGERRADLDEHAVEITHVAHDLTPRFLAGLADRRRTRSYSPVEGRLHILSHEGYLEAGGVVARPIGPDREAMAGCH